MPIFPSVENISGSLLNWKQTEISNRWEAVSHNKQITFYLNVGFFNLMVSSLEIIDLFILKLRTVFIYSILGLCSGSELIQKRCYGYGI